MEVPPEDREKVNHYLYELGYTWFDETGNPDYTLFLGYKANPRVGGVVARRPIRSDLREVVNAHKCTDFTEFRPHHCPFAYRSSMLKSVRSTLSL